MLMILPVLSLTVNAVKYSWHPSNFNLWTPEPYSFICIARCFTKSLKFKSAIKYVRACNSRSNLHKNLRILQESWLNVWALKTVQVMDARNNHCHIKYKTHKDGIIATLQDQRAAETELMERCSDSNINNFNNSILKITVKANCVLYKCSLF